MDNVNPFAAAATHNEHYGGIFDHNFHTPCIDNAARYSIFLQRGMPRPRIRLPDFMVDGLHGGWNQGVMAS